MTGLGEKGREVYRVAGVAGVGGGLKGYDDRVEGVSAGITRKGRDGSSR